MATRDEIVAKLARLRVRRHYLPNLSRQAIKQAAQGISDLQWDDIIQGIRDRDDALTGKALALPVQEYLMGLATADVEAKLGQDDTLTIDEIIELL